MGVSPTVSSLAALLALVAGHAASAENSALVVTLRPAPVELEPVAYLARAPEIDGRLDPSLADRLAARPFSQAVASTPGLPVPEARYRLGYGATFLYLEIEAAGDRLTCRDRAFQNGDGFHLVLARPTPDGAPSREFYVVAGSAVDRPEAEWTRRVIWYYNVDHLFLPLSREARMEAAAAGGTITFELLLPWQDVHPFHPWLGEIGFNLAFAKAERETDSTQLLVVPDGGIQMEQHPRAYARLPFAPPPADAPTASFVQLDRGSLTEGGTLGGRVAGVGPPGADDTVTVTLRSGEGARLGRQQVAWQAGNGVTTAPFELDARELPPGGYRVEWQAMRAGTDGEAAFSVLPAVAAPALLVRTAALGDRIAAGSRATIRFLLEEAAAQLTAVKPYESPGTERIRLEQAAELLRRAEAGEDVLAARSGLVRRAFRSAQDGTLQPYTVRVPATATRRPLPLVVYLHGSGSDETSIPRAGVLSAGDALELCPRGRGTSHAWSVPEAQRDVVEATDDAAANYPVDRGRVVLAGFSMGGYGAYRTFWQDPKRYRAVAVFSGHPDLGNRWLGRDDQPDFLEAKNLAVSRGVPVFVYHGTRDRNTPFELTEKLVSLLRDAGARVEFCTEEGAGHGMPGPRCQAVYLRWLAALVEPAPSGGS
jgi:predicted esterase